jgi:putative phosphonate metabolism protein
MRYAIYYAPEPKDPLAAFGRAWLGRDAETGAAVDQPQLDGKTPQWLADITAEPRRYGFHGTLKAPFHLAAGSTEEDLLRAATAFAAVRPSVAVPRLALRAMGDFIALVPQMRVPTLDALAGDCVRSFDVFRAPPEPAELARRREGLSTRQAELLVQWGYPYVLDEFRFLLTLTGKLSSDDRKALMPVLEKMTDPFKRTPLAIRSICIFKQPEPDAPFTVLARFPLARR